MHLVCGNQPIIDQWQAAVETRNILARSQVPRLSEVGHVHMGSRSNNSFRRRPIGSFNAAVKSFHALLLSRMI
ncbi:hypothetical protein BLIG_02155 [Bifidobacterium longum subsp. infantis CCUG 52486]|uniref:Uncharacterized protein n=1 Tax=Bifidobacterium longum subsp. infantis CCUG 52486 TaxID=537937 RepID=C5EDD2_BIFLI|nr:hypothetical protein BLIG_02155 [Bifidobacterium longum subsp. infantis CCUG 52486]